MDIIMCIHNRVFLAPAGSSLDTVIESYDKYYSQISSVRIIISEGFVIHFTQDNEDRLLEQIEPVKAVNNFK